MLACKREDLSDSLSEEARREGRKCAMYCNDVQLFGLSAGLGVGGRGGRDASEGEGAQRRPQKRLDRRLQEVAKAVGGGYCC